MKKIIFLSIIIITNLTVFSQDDKSGGQLFTFNYGHKNFSNQSNYPHNSAGMEYLIAGKRIGLALRGNLLFRGDDPHIGVGASGKLFWGSNSPGGFYNGFGVDALFIDGRQIMPRGDIGYNLVINKFAMGFEFVVGYDIGYSYSTTGYQASYFGGIFVGGEFKIGFAF